MVKQKWTNFSFLQTRCEDGLMDCRDSDEVECHLFESFIRGLPLAKPLKEVLTNYCYEFKKKRRRKGSK
jgi:hypothetical protein